MLRVHSPTQDLRKALEVNLNIVNASKQDFIVNLTKTGDDFSCKDKKKSKKKHKGPTRNTSL